MQGESCIFKPEIERAFRDYHHMAGRMAGYFKRVLGRKNIFGSNVAAYSGALINGSLNTVMTPEFMQIEGLTPEALQSFGLDAIITAGIIGEMSTMMHIILTEQGNSLGVNGYDYNYFLGQACKSATFRTGLLQNPGIRQGNLRCSEGHDFLVMPEGCDNGKCDFVSYLNDSSLFQAFLDTLKLRTASETGFNFLAYLAGFSIHEKAMLQIDSSSSHLFNKLIGSTRESKTPGRGVYTIDTEAGLLEGRIVNNGSQKLEAIALEVPLQRDYHASLVSMPNTFVIKPGACKFNTKRYIAALQQLNPSFPCSYITGLANGTRRHRAASAVFMMDVRYSESVAEFYNLFLDGRCIDELLEAIDNLHGASERCRTHESPLLAAMSDSYNLMIRRVARLLYGELGKNDEAISLMELAAERGKLDGDSYLYLSLLCAKEALEGGEAHAGKEGAYFSKGMSKSPNDFNKRLSGLVLRYIHLHPKIKLKDKDCLNEIAGIADSLDALVLCTVEKLRGTEITPAACNNMHILVEVSQFSQRILADLIESPYYKGDKKCLERKLMCAKIKTWEFLRHTNYTTNPARVYLTPDGRVFFLDSPEIVGNCIIMPQYAFTDGSPEKFLIARAAMDRISHNLCTHYLSLFDTVPDEAENRLYLAMMQKASMPLTGVLLSDIDRPAKMNMLRKYMLLQDLVALSMTSAVKQGASNGRGGLIIEAPVEGKMYPAKVHDESLYELLARSLLARKEDDSFGRLPSDEDMNASGKYNYRNPAINQMLTQLARYIDVHINLNGHPDGGRKRELLQFMTEANHMDATPDNCLIMNIGRHCQLQFCDWDQFGISTLPYRIGYTLAHPCVNEQVFGNSANSQEESALIREMILQAARGRGFGLKPGELELIERMCLASKPLACIRRVFGVQSRLRDEFQAEAVITRFVDYSLAMRPDNHSGTSYDLQSPGIGLLYSFTNAVLQADETCHSNLQKALIWHSPRVVCDALMLADAATYKRIERLHSEALTHAFAVDKGYFMTRRF